MEHLPAKIIIVRHSEREDHMRPEWHLDATRPHDPPITTQGKGLCQKLGRYLASERSVAPETVVLLSSPLQRCVQTSHAIAEGLGGTISPPPSADGAPLLDTIPIHIEPGLIEGVYWMQHDLNKAHALRCEKTKDRHLPHPAPPTPVYMPTAWLHSNVSPLVRSERFALCEDPQYSNNPKAGLCEDVHVKNRCLRAAQALPACRRFAGKTVICVGHGQTTLLWFNALSATPSDIESPPYTGFAELAPVITGSGSGTVLWVPQMAPFRQPHLEA